MPILDVEVVTRDVPLSVDTGALAHALGAALDSVPGSVWVRVRHLAAADYAENGDQPDPLPVFVRVIARTRVLRRRTGFALKVRRFRPANMRGETTFEGRA